MKRAKKPMKPSNDTSTNARANKQKLPAKSAGNPMWGGAYGVAADEALANINASVQFDYKLAPFDIEGSLAHSAMLAQTGILTKAEAADIATHLKAIAREVAEGKFAFSKALEDVHMNIESALSARTKAGEKLHTARSRNDQVATDFRLYVRAQCDAVEAQLKALQAVLIARAEEHAATIIPGFTHLQTAQPVTLGHHLLAYVEMFGRDRSRFADARKRLNESPLGAAALAGTSFPINREMTAKALGFDRPMKNSMDAVSDRDFVMEFLAASSILAVHLSRLAEEMIVWSSSAFGFIRFSDAFSTGSSIMPQKRNPDAAELVRGKTGRVVGALVAMLTTMKALPLAYNKDMQEDKEPVFDVADTLTLCLAAMRGMVLDFTADKAAMRAAAAQGYSTATDLADWLVRALNIPFRKAHHVSANIVRIASEKKCELSALSLKEMQQVEPRITKDIFSVLTVEQSVQSRVSLGGTAPSQVRKAIAAAKKQFLVK